MVTTDLMGLFLGLRSKVKELEKNSISISSKTNRVCLTCLLEWYRENWDTSYTVRVLATTVCRSC